MLAGLGVTLCAGEFVPPAEGPIAFRLDKIPLDKEVIEGLAKQLETLARGFKAEKAADRRGAAQMLALAMALDPGKHQGPGIVGILAAGPAPGERG